MLLYSNPEVGVQAEETMVGFVQYVDEHDHLRVWNVALRPESRGRGLGSDELPLAAQPRYVARGAEAGCRAPTGPLGMPPRPFSGVGLEDPSGDLREEDDLVARFEGVAVYAGRTTRPGMRTMHFVAEDLERVRATIDAWALDLPPRRIKVNFAHDIDWTFRTDLGIG
jgi:hypothetical protein